MARSTPANKDLQAMSDTITPAGTVEARLVASLDHWKRNLLDLSKRNRALNFKATRVSTVSIIDEQPAEVFRQLYVEGGLMRFKPAPEGHGANTVRPVTDSAGAMSVDETNQTGTQPGLFDELTSDVSVDYAPYDPETLADRYTDDILQTSATRDQLDRSLRRLDEQARLSIEEQGVNILYITLGMLHYKEAAPSTEMLRAPLVLIPVQLLRKSARVGYAVQATEDEPLVNPGLAEHFRRDFNLDLPELPDSANMPEDYDLQEFFQNTRANIAEHRDWSVKTEIYLGLFSFQKLAMYKDLETNGLLYKEHRLVRQLVSRKGSAHLGLPSDVQSIELDKGFSPESTFQVVDADSSQLRALAAVTRNYDLVIEGPPGTGKSQTITNLIAQALAGRKSILFVAEKMAALQVVHQRLMATGLSEFCLQLHSTKANKRQVMKELGKTLDASLQTPAVPRNPSALRLPKVRQSLTDYADAVHTSHGALKMTVFDMYGELGAVLHAPKLKYSGPTDTVTPDIFDQTLRDIDELVTAVDAIGVLSQHPWREATKTYYSEVDLDAIGDLAQRLLERLESLVVQAKRVEADLSLPPIGRLADIQTTVAIAAVLGRSPGAPLAVLQNEIWNAPPPEAQALVGLLRTARELKTKLQQNFAADVFHLTVTSDIAYVELKSQGAFRFLAFLDSRYRDIQKRWRAIRLPHYRAALLQQAQDMKELVRLQEVQGAIVAAAGEAQQLFGVLWQGIESIPETLDDYIRWVVEFRTVCVQHGLTGRALEAATKPEPSVDAVTQLEHISSEVSALLHELQVAVGWPQGFLQDAALHEIGTRIYRLGQSINLGPRWATFEAARQAVAQGLATEVLRACLSGDFPFKVLRATFLRAFYQKWLSAIIQSRPELRGFNTMTHEQRVKEFRQLDRRVLEENQVALIAGLREEAQRRLQMPNAIDAMPVLRRELARQRGLSPLRQTLKRAFAAIRAIKPCFMMSPLSVAQLLDGTTTFDLVIFDEASQLTTEDAIGAIVRGKQIVVVGDPKQLPPTNFFAVMSGQEPAPLGDDDTPLYEDSESVLEDYLASGVPASRLKWHYRSAHESLIAFSNANFYDGDLYTFPSSEPLSSTAGLSFEWVSNGVYTGKGLNIVEARRVADAVIEHARKFPELSLGVGTFNQRQQLAIQDELERRRREDPSLEAFFARKEQNEFFVKNLETIQGDERDVIFISVTYAKGLDGRLRYNFGPLNSQNGWRRLNVLVTRARKIMRVFSSMRGEDINPQAAASPGPLLLRDFLIYAEHGRLDSPQVQAAANTESPFELDVLQALSQKGIRLIPQVGVSGFRIDFGVVDPSVPGRFICGLECDGVAYHSSATARDRDRLRQQVLEARGWTIHRVWSTDWFKDRQGQIERLLSLIQASQEHARKVAAAATKAHPKPLEKSGSETPQPQSDSAEVELLAYERPVTSNYRLATTKTAYTSDILTCPPTQIAQAIRAVVEIEAPLHQEDLIARVAGMWGVKLGVRILTRLVKVLQTMVQGRQVPMRGDFIYRADGKMVVRSRANTKINPEHIAPEEYREAILLVLSTGHSFPVEELASEVRAVLGYGKTTAPIQKAVEAQIQQLLEQKIIGEASLGLMLRQS
jgi:very-short-patch-repair endonuclease